MTGTTRTQPPEPPTGAEARRRLLADLPVTEERAELAGVPTAMLTGGDGPPLVLLHGPLEQAVLWLRVLPDLVATHRVIVPDLPGHGASAGLDGTPTLERTLAWVEALISATCAQPPVVVGHAFGGAIAARFAAAHPDRVAALALVDTLGLVPLAPAPEFGQALQGYLAEPTTASHEELWRRCAHDLATLQAEMGARWELFVVCGLDNTRSPELQATQQAVFETFGMPAIPPEELARIAVPTTLIWGRHDRATPLAVAENASARHGWPLEVIDDCGVDSMMERPEAFVRALHRALTAAGHRASATT